jgi:hypothetical protein
LTTGAVELGSSFFTPSFHFYEDDRLSSLSQAKHHTSGQALNPCRGDEPCQGILFHILENARPDIFNGHDRIFQKIDWTAGHHDVKKPKSSETIIALRSDYSREKRKRERCSRKWILTMTFLDTRRR